MELGIIWAVREHADRVAVNQWNLVLSGQFGSHADRVAANQWNLVLSGQFGSHADRMAVNQWNLVLSGCLRRYENRMAVHWRNLVLSGCKCRMAADTWIGNYYVDASGAWVTNSSPGAAQWISSGGRCGIGMEMEVIQLVVLKTLEEFVITLMRQDGW